MYTNYKEISDRNGFFEQGVKFQVPKKVADTFPEKNKCI